MEELVSSGTNKGISCTNKANTMQLLNCLRLRFLQLIKYSPKKFKTYCNLIKHIYCFDFSEHEAGMIESWHCQSPLSSRMTAMNAVTQRLYVHREHACANNWKDIIVDLLICCRLFCWMDICIHNNLCDNKNLRRKLYDIGKLYASN